MDAEIKKQLREIERQHDVKVLYAVESGSRAWGFPSKESDYDVRFVYVHRRDWYLSIDQKRDVIEKPISNMLDISGWDLRKALQLLAKSNPALLEWLRSPIVYEEAYTTAQSLRNIGLSHLSKKAVMYHYLHMAKGNYQDYLRGETVKVKKYFYVLRPIFVCMWLENEQSIPPVEFGQLLQAQQRQLASSVLQELQELIARKKAGEELGEEAALPALHIFIQDKLSYYEQYAKQLEQKGQTNIDLLNRLFRETLAEVWERG